MDFTLTRLTVELLEVSLLALVGFMLTMALTPVYTFFAYRFQWWKKQRSDATTGEALQIFTELHKKKFERRIPTMAGIVLVVSIIIVTVLLNLNREQTWLPLAALVGGAVVGFIDDLVNIKGKGKGAAGLRSGLKFSMITVVALVGAWFFYDKLGVSAVQVPFYGAIDIGWAIIPFFVLAVVSTGNAVNISDGLDGLAGGLLATSYGAFAFIAMMQGSFALAGFCFTILGVLLAYIWFNIYPARFFMGDTGSFALGTALGVVSMLTNSILLLPIIGLVFVAEAGSSLIQILSKKIRHKKIFLSAPIHHHLEAIGWPETKVTMRFWVIGVVCASVGLLLALAGGHV